MPNEWGIWTPRGTTRKFPGPRKSPKAKPWVVPLAVPLRGPFAGLPPGRIAPTKGSTGSITLKDMGQNWRDEADRLESNQPRMTLPELIGERAAFDVLGCQVGRITDQAYAPWPAVSAGDLLVKTKTDPDKLTNSWDPTKSGSCVKMEFRSASACARTVSSTTRVAYRLSADREFRSAPASSHSVYARPFFALMN